MISFPIKTLMKRSFICLNINYVVLLTGTFYLLRISTSAGVFWKVAYQCPTCMARKASEVYRETMSIRHVRRQLRLVYSVARF